MADILRDPCANAEECFDPATGDPCLYGCDENGCLDNNSSTEEPNVGVNYDLMEYAAAIEIEDRINDEELDLCSKGILENLKNLEQNDIASILYKFGVPNSTYQMDVITTEVGWAPLQDGRSNWYYNTDGRIPYEYFAKIRTGHVNQSTDLGIASTLLHEIIHVYFFSIIDDCSLENNCGLLEDFPDLWNFFIENGESDLLDGPS